jgi:NAD(P)-dependent dehydrogenase (short-subunit alcohol dehydrogenase family)
LLKGGPEDWNTPIWHHDLDKGLRILELAIDTHLITSHHLLPLLIDKPGGLLVEVTDGTAAYNASHYRISVFYDLAKVAVTRLAFSQGHELESQGGAAVAITPGWLRSEMMLDNFGLSEANWRQAVDRKADGDRSSSAPPDFALSESPRYVGRAIVALATDPPVPDGTRNRSAPESLRASTASPISMAHNPTSGAISKKFASVG